MAKTAYAFSVEKINHLIDYYFEGIFKQQVYGIYTDVSVVNRSITHKAKFEPHRTLEIEWLVGLHRKMFGEVWSWAGQLRRTQRNIGVDFTMVRIELVQLLENARAQLDSGLDRELVATYFHHGLLFVHPFPNGNGRWARRVTEAQCDGFGIRPPTWISLAPSEVPEFRARYLDALREGDRGDLAKLRAVMFGN